MKVKIFKGEIRLGDTSSFTQDLTTKRITLNKPSERMETNFNLAVVIHLGLK